LFTLVIGDVATFATDRYREAAMAMAMEYMC
jgi:hypothetical protein